MRDQLDQAIDALSEGRIDEAVALYTELIEAGAGGIAPLLDRAGIHAQRGALAAAEADRARAVALAPDEPEPRMRLGQLAYSMGRNILAARHMADALACPPHHHEMAVNAANAYDALDWLDLAYRVVRPLPDALPDWWANVVRRARTRWAAEHGRARATLRGRRASTDPHLVAWDLSNQLYRLGRLRPARRLCEWCMKDRPWSFPAFEHYARIEARQAGPAAAAAFLRGMAWLHRDTHEYPMVLARYLHEEGRFAEVLAATAHLAVEQEPDDLRYRKGIALLALGRTAELRLYCRAWMAAAPHATQPAGFITAAPWAPDEAPEFAAAPAAPPAAPVRPHIVQFWDKRPIPEDVAATMATWTACHPQAAYTAFDEPDARAFLYAHYGAAAVATWDRCHHVAMKVDYFRLAFLHQAGGLYVDADERCLRPLGDLLELGGRAEAIACLSGDVPGYLHNWFLGARAGSRIMRSAMAEIEVEVGRHHEAGTRPDIWQVTGPGLVTRAVARFLTAPRPADAGPVVLLPFRRYRSLARTDGDLAYKREGAQNWQLA